MVASSCSSEKVRMMAFIMHCIPSASPLRRQMFSVAASRFSMVRPFVKRIGSESSNLSTMGLATRATPALARLKARYPGEPVNLLSPPPEPGVLSEASGIFWRRVEMLSSSFAGWREQYRYR